MKILLIGEFSGVHNNLKTGLQKLGHDVILAADGDSYRNFNSDVKLTPYENISKVNFVRRYITHIRNLLHFFRHYRKFFGNDVVQFIHPLVILPNLFLATWFIFLFNKKSSYYVCGTDPAMLKARDYFKYFPFDGEIVVEYSKISNKYYNWFIRKVNMIIPSMYSYYVGYYKSDKLNKPIPLPGRGIYKKTIEPTENKKLQILHGITRYNFKGSDYILKALKKIEERYEEYVDIVIVEKLPFDEYYSLYMSADIIIDQCKSYDYGMNAIYGLEHSKIVLSGSEDIAMNYMQYSNVPVINITPDADDIYKKIEDIITKSDIEIVELKDRSCQHVKNYHNPITIANKFVKTYEMLDNRQSNKFLISL